MPITITEAKIDERFDDFAEHEILLLPSNNTSRIHLLVNIFNEIFMVPQSGTSPK